MKVFEVRGKKAFTYLLYATCTALYGRADLKVKVFAHVLNSLAQWQDSALPLDLAPISVALGLERIKTQFFSLLGKGEGDGSSCMRDEKTVQELLNVAYF